MPRIPDSLEHPDCLETLGCLVEKMSGCSPDWKGVWLRLQKTQEDGLDHEAEMVGSVGGAQLEMGGKSARGMDRQRWWKVWEGHSWKWEGKSARAVADLRFDKGGYKSKIRMRANFLREPRPLFDRGAVGSPGCARSVCVG